MLYVGKLADLAFQPCAYYHHEKLNRGVPTDEA